MSRARRVRSWLGGLAGLAETPAGRRTPAGLGVLMAMVCVAGSGCSTSWRAGLVTLQIDGVDYRGDVTVPASWTTQAVLLGDGLVAAQAHLLVGARSVRVGGVALDRVVHLDRAAELVVLASAQARPPLPCAPGGQGVVADVASGPSSAVAAGQVVVVGEISTADGLVVDDATGCFMGTAVRGLFVPRPTFTTVAGKSLDEVLSPLDLAPLIEKGASRRACLAPGEALRIAVGTVWPSVLTVQVRPEGPGLGAALVEGASVMWKGLADGASLLAFERRGGGAGGAASVVVVNPARSTGRICATVDVGEVAWERPLGRRLRSAAGAVGSPEASERAVRASEPSRRLEVTFEVGPAQGDF